MTNTIANPYTLVLTPIEEACGVTLDAVGDTLTQALMRDGACILPENTPPALAGAVARCAFAGPVEFRGLNSLGMPVYRAA